MSESNNKEHLLAVRKALLDLQKEILESLKEQFQKESGRAVPPGEWLQVLMVSQRYEWMRELTTLIADIDLLTELEEISHQHASTARYEIERMLFASEEEAEEEFQKQYRLLLKAAAHMIPLHGHLRSVVSPLPQRDLTTEEAMAERKLWHDIHWKESRKKRN